MTREPVVIATAVRAVLLAAVALGLHLSGAQLAALYVAVEAVLAVVTRRAVTPVAGVSEGVSPPA